MKLAARAPASAQSGALQTSKIAGRPSDAREWHLRHLDAVVGPYISSSHFIPASMVAHLMRRKKDSALGVKFVARNNPPDDITDMEGALHTYVTPIVLAWIYGDYRYSRGHRVVPFGHDKATGHCLARQVIVSALIHPDFEREKVMMRVARLSDSEILGRESLPHMATIEQKQDDISRAAYETQLRKFMVYHLTASHRLPAMHDIKEIKSAAEIVSVLDGLIGRQKDPGSSIKRQYLALARGKVLSLEILFNSAVQQIRNELLALEDMCPQGYNYTYDPPAIFAMCIGAEILTRLHIAALQHVTTTMALMRMRVFAFNDYADRPALQLLRIALKSQPSVKVMPKSWLFHAESGFYMPPEGTSHALLVLHNNSDAFGQNIETEGDGTSMDGAIGVNSSAAASLARNREDLLDAMRFN